MKTLLLAVAGIILTPLGMRAETIEIIASRTQRSGERTAANSGADPNCALAWRKEVEAARCYVRSRGGPATGCDDHRARCAGGARSARRGAAPEKLSCGACESFGMRIWPGCEARTARRTAKPCIPASPLDSPGGARGIDIAAVPARQRRSARTVPAPSARHRHLSLMCSTRSISRSVMRAGWSPRASDSARIGCAILPREKTRPRAAAHG
jgi:hypothetical protein